MDKLHSVPRSRFTLCGTCVFICLYYKPIADVKQCISTNPHVPKLSSVYTMCNNYDNSCHNFDIYIHNLNTKLGNINNIVCSISNRNALYI